MKPAMTLRPNDRITLNGGKYTNPDHGFTFRARKPGIVWQLNYGGTIMVRFGGKMFECPPSAVTRVY